MTKKNDQFLMDEYKLHNMAPKVISLNNQKLIVPYEYAAEGDDWQIKRYFLSDYLDLQQIEAEKYRKNGEMPKTIRLGEVTYIVPFAKIKQNISGQPAARVGVKIT